MYVYAGPDLYEQIFVHIKGLWLESLKCFKSSSVVPLMLYVHEKTFTENIITKLF